MSEEPTKRQQELLDFMADWERLEGCPPTVREMMYGLDVQSPNGVMCHLVALQKKGYVAHSRPGRSRGWALVTVEEVFTCPHCGGEVEL